MAATRRLNYRSFGVKLNMAEINDIFHEFAAAFAGAFDDAKPICFPSKLCRDALDLSLASLKHVDEYLVYLHNRKDELDPNEWNSTVLYGGAYVGEVIRHETNNHYRWIDYDDYMPQHPDLQAMIPERSTPTCAFLVDDNGKMSMPLNKIARFIDEGEENSVHFLPIVTFSTQKTHNDKMQLSCRRAAHTFENQPRQPADLGRFTEKN